MKKISILYFVFLVLLCVLLLSLFLDTAQSEEKLKNDLNLVTVEITKIIGDEKYARIFLKISGRALFTEKNLDSEKRFALCFDKENINLSNHFENNRSFLKNIYFGGYQARNCIFFAAKKKFYTKIIENTFSEEKNETDLIVSFQTETLSLKEKQRKFRVVLDPGHGGIDTGALGKYNVYEKNVTLIFANLLRSILKENPKIDVKLTREKDIFLKLSDRVEIARQWNADLFISIHADSIGTSTLRGATVYTLSDKASDEIANKLAKNENKAEIIGNIAYHNSQEVNNILFDLLQKETHFFSNFFATNLVDHLKKNKIILIKNTHRYAAFQVLKAPDVPSVLVELGYLSNLEDEKLITNPSWRLKMANLIADSIEKIEEYRSNFE